MPRKPQRKLSAARELRELLLRPCASGEPVSEQLAAILSALQEVETIEHLWESKSCFDGSHFVHTLQVLVGIEGSLDEKEIHERPDLVRCLLVQARLWIVKLTLLRDTSRQREKNSKDTPRDLLLNTLDAVSTVLDKAEALLDEMELHERHCVGKMLDRLRALLPPYLPTPPDLPRSGKWTELWRIHEELSQREDDLAKDLLGTFEGDVRDHEGGERASHVFTADNALKEIVELRDASPLGHLSTTPIHLPALSARVHAVEKALWIHFGSEALGHTSQLATAIAHLSCAVSEGRAAIWEVFRLLSEAETGVTVSARIRIYTPHASRAFQELLSFSVQGADNTNTSRIAFALRRDGTAADIWAGGRSTDTESMKFFLADANLLQNEWRHVASVIDFDDGVMDEPRIYSRALGAGEIADVERYTGLMGLWRLNDMTGTTAADFSGNSNDGTLTNGPTWVAGKIGPGLNFDGTVDCAGLGDLESGTMALRGTDITGRNGSPGSIQSRIENGGSSYLATTPASWMAGTWHHFALTYGGGTSATSKTLTSTGAAEIAGLARGNGTGLAAVYYDNKDSAGAFEVHYHASIASKYLMYHSQDHAPGISRWIHQFENHEILRGIHEVDPGRGSPAAQGVTQRHEDRHRPGPIYGDSTVACFHEYPKPS